MLIVECAHAHAHPPRNPHSTITIQKGINNQRSQIENDLVMPKIRLDQLVVERGLAPSRERARALILAGQVVVAGVAVAKAGTAVDPEAPVELLAPVHPYVGRGGLKPAHALDPFAIPVA